MRAAIFRNGEIVVDTLPEPKPGAGAVLVKTLACGICGSDLHARKHAHRMAELSRHLPGRKPMDLARDVVFGHEFCCEILDYGPATQRKLKAGTRVCSLPALLTPEGPQGIGYSNDHVGGYAERMLLSEALLLEVPNGLAAEHAALTEPLAVGIHAVAKANVRGDEVPLVIGCGPVGLAVIAAIETEGFASDRRRGLFAGAPRFGSAARRRRRRGSCADPALCDLGRACRDVGRAKGGAAAVAGVAAGAQASADLRMCRDTRPAAAGVRRRTARCPHRGGRRLHGNRSFRADARHHEGTQRSICAGLHAR